MGPNSQMVLGIAWTELYRIWGEHGLVIFQICSLISKLWQLDGDWSRKSRSNFALFVSCEN